MYRHLLRFLGLALGLLLSLPYSSAQTFEPEFAKGPFTASGAVPGVSLQEIAGNLALGPVTAITNAGDGRLFLTMRNGLILIYENGGVLSQPFLDVRGLTTTDGERGLLSTAFHPRYAENGFFFIDYTNNSGDSVVARYRASADDPNRADPASARTLLTVGQPFANHNGGQLQFGPDGYLYIGLGDGGSGFDPGCRAQRADTLLGKLLRLDVDQNAGAPPFYGIPADNPFRGPGDPPDEVWALGLRNPWRFSFDRSTGDLWIGDVGQNQREEIDFQPASAKGGENYGWKVMEGTLCSTADACPAGTPACDSSAFTPPVLEYAHNPHCAVTGGYVYRGGIAQIRGAYVFGDLCSGVVWAAFRQGAGFTVRTVAGQAPQLTTFGEDAAGELYAATLGGKLFRFAGAAAGGTAETVGLFDPKASKFQLKTANSAAGKVIVVRFGPRRNPWIPLAGDWDGDGTTTVGFYDPANAIFRLKNSTPGGLSDVILKVDPPSAHVVPIAGDWDGDGRDTVGLYDETTGTFHLKNSLAGSGFDLTVGFGAAGAGLLPIAGDWDGNGVDRVGVFDPAQSVFTLKRSFAGGGPPDVQFQFGPRGSLPVAGDWNGDGRDGVGVYDPSSAVFRLKNGLAAGKPDFKLRFGPRHGGWKPLAGTW
jgi:glucose/arabinose dehydrogenase